MEAIKDDFHYLDEALWLRCPQIKDEDIWGNVDEDECQALAKLLLKKARRSPIAASVVRTAIDTHDYLVVGALFVPRIHRTVQALRAAPKRERKPLKLVRSME